MKNYVGFITTDVGMDIRVCGAEDWEAADRGIHEEAYRIWEGYHPNVVWVQELNEDIVTRLREVAQSG